MKKLIFSFVFLVFAVFTFKLRIMRNLQLRHNQIQMLLKSLLIRPFMIMEPSCRVQTVPANSNSPIPEKNR